MDLQNEKCVMVIDEQLPPGLAANTAGIMGLTLGKQIPEAIGPDVVDASGSSHLGIIEFPVPVLKASRETLKKLRQQLYQPEFESLVAVDFSDVAQGCRTYEEYIGKAAGTDGQSLVYYGIGICGPKKLVNRLTGNLPLLR